MIYHIKNSVKKRIYTFQWELIRWAQRKNS